MDEELMPHDVLGLSRADRLPGIGERIKAASRAAVGIFSDTSWKQAMGLLAGVLPGAAGTPPTRGTQEYLKAYSEMPWLRAVASRIATSVGQAEWQLFVVKGKEPTARARKDGVVKRMQRASRPERVRLLKQAAKDEELTQITDHPMLDVLHDANEFQTGLAMRKVTQLHLDLTGDAFWLKERDAQGTVVGVWPIPPHWILATPTPAFRFFRVSFKAWRGNIPDTEFLWFSDDDPWNPYGRGTGTARALADELETDEYAAKHTKAYFYNQARPDLIVMPRNGSSITQGNINRLEEDWLSKNQGFWKQFKPYFMSREVEVKELDSMGNFRAQQLVQLRQHERDTILQVFGMPPEILGVLTSSNRSTIDAASYLMAKYVVEPRLEFLRSVLQERLVPEYDDRLVVEFVSPVQDDQASQLQAATAAPWALNLNEWRKLAGQPQMEDEEAGKLRMLSAALKPTSVEQLLHPPPPPGFDENGQPLAPPQPVDVGTGDGINGAPPKPGIPTNGNTPQPAARPKPPKPGARALAFDGVPVNREIYRMASRMTLSTYRPGDQFTFPGNVTGVESPGELDVAMLEAGYTKDDVTRVCIVVPNGVALERQADGGFALPKGLTYRLTRLGEGTADLQVVA